MSSTNTCTATRSQLVRHRIQRITISLTDLLTAATSILSIDKQEGIGEESAGHVERMIIQMDNKDSRFIQNGG